VPADEQVVIRRLAEPVLGLAGDTGRRPTRWRVLIAGLLLVGGLVILLSGRVSYRLLWPLAGVILVIAAIGILLGPWWLRITRTLAVERPRPSMGCRWRW
jgi:hypothetical protein